MDTNFFADMTLEDALALEEYFVERHARRRRLGYATPERERESVRFRRQLIEQFPDQADAPRYTPRKLTHEETQIERIGAAIWEMFHERHGGEFDPSSDSMANTMTMQAADRAWAIARESETPPHSLGMQLLSDLNARMVEGEWDMLNEVCETRDPTRMSGSETMSYLRTLYCARDKLPAYGDFLARSKQAFARRGRPVERLFRGLEE